MMLPHARKFAVRTALTVAGLLVVAIDASAEPPACYAGRPAVLPAPIDYGPPYRASASTIVYADSRAYQSYRRTYSSPAYAYETAPLLRAARYSTPVVYDAGYYAPVYDATYYAPQRVVRLTSQSYYGGHRLYGHYRGNYYRPSHSYASFGYARHGHHGSRRHSRWGFSVGYGRGHHGRHGGFSFRYSH